MGRHSFRAPTKEARRRRWPWVVAGLPLLVVTLIVVTGGRKGSDAAPARRRSLGTPSST